MQTNVPSEPNGGAVLPADCGCGGKSAPGLVYALGALGFDFGTRDTRDAMIAANGGRPIVTNEDLAAFLSQSSAKLADFDGIVWTLARSGDPIYAIRPTPNHSLSASAFADLVLSVLPSTTVDWLAVPGSIVGSATLLDGRVIPVINPDVRGIERWSSQDVALDVKLTGSTAQASTVTVDLASEGPLDWSCWNTMPPVTKQSPVGPPIGPLSAIRSGAPGVLTTYTSTVVCTWTGGAFVVSGSSIVGVSASAAVGGLQLSVPLRAGGMTLRIHARAFGCSARLDARISPPSPGTQSSYVDTSFEALPPIAGLPGVVDGIFTIVVPGPPSDQQQLLVELMGTPSAVVSSNPASVTLYSEPSASGQMQTLGVGIWPATILTVPSIQSVYVPAGLRLTLLSENEGGIALTANQPGTFTDIMDNSILPLATVIVEPENYVGVQAATLDYGAPVSAEALQSFVDRLRRLLDNRGISSEARAINYASMRALGVFAGALALGLAPEAITAEPLALSRPGADCWDVKFVFFHPLQVAQGGRRIVRMTVDVAGPRPITLSPPRTWTER
jgi:hypothetical protein